MIKGNTEGLKGECFIVLGAKDFKKFLLLTMCEKCFERCSNLVLLSLAVDHRLERVKSENMHPRTHTFIKLIVKLPGKLHYNRW